MNGLTGLLYTPKDSTLETLRPMYSMPSLNSLNLEGFAEKGFYMPVESILKLAKETGMIIVKITEGTAKAAVEISNHTYGAGKATTRVAKKAVDVATKFPKMD
jgi:hypothetical protein